MSLVAGGAWMRGKNFPYHGTWSDRYLTARPTYELGSTNGFGYRIGTYFNLSNNPEAIIETGITLALQHYSTPISASASEFHPSSFVHIKHQFRGHVHHDFTTLFIPFRIGGRFGHNEILASFNYGIVFETNAFEQGELTSIDYNPPLPGDTTVQAPSISEQHLSVNLRDQDFARFCFEMELIYQHIFGRHLMAGGNIIIDYRIIQGSPTREAQVLPTFSIGFQLGWRLVSSPAKPRSG